MNRFAASVLVPHPWPVETLARHRWPVGTLVRHRRDTTVFASLMVIGHLSGSRVRVVPVEPPPWATDSERAVRVFLEGTLRPFAPPPRRVRQAEALGDT